MGGLRKSQTLPSSCKGRPARRQPAPGHSSHQWSAPASSCLLADTASRKRVLVRTEPAFVRCSCTSKSNRSVCTEAEQMRDEHTTSAALMIKSKQDLGDQSFSLKSASTNWKVLFLNGSRKPQIASVAVRSGRQAGLVTAVH